MRCPRRLASAGDVACGTSYHRCMADRQPGGTAAGGREYEHNWSRARAQLVQADRIAVQTRDREVGREGADGQARRDGVDDLPRAGERLPEVLALAPEMERESKQRKRCQSED